MVFTLGHVYCLYLLYYGSTTLTVSTNFHNDGLEIVRGPLLPCGYERPNFESRWKTFVTVSGSSHRDLYNAPARCCD
jgi:hypothetical protein